MKTLQVLAMSLLVLSGCKAQPTLRKLAQTQLAKPPMLVTFKLTNYTPYAGRQLGDLFVSNFSIKANRGNLELSSARDGLSDELKKHLSPKYGFLVNGGAYTTGTNFFSDLMIYLTGVTVPNQGLLFCSFDQQHVSAGDEISYSDVRTQSAQLLGLYDCERLYLGLDIHKFDYDGDGIPDYLELRCGTNPRNPGDALISAAADGISNLEKCKRNIPIDETGTSQANTTFAYKYQKDRMTDGTYTITVSNIPIVEEGADNLIAFYLTEKDVSSYASSTGGTTANQRPHLYTGFTILTNQAPGKTFTIDFQKDWASGNPSGSSISPYTSREFQFQ